MNFNLDGSLPSRFYSQMCLGFASKVAINDDEGKSTSYEHKPNLAEKAGNEILWVVGSIPRSIHWINRQFHDPRVVTVALTALALFTATLCFYPTATVAAVEVAAITIKALITSIPLWSVKFAGYLLTCSTITGYGLRNLGRFTNADLMIAFYGLPDTFVGNPCYLTIDEIRALRKHKIVEA